MDTKVEEN